MNAQIASAFLLLSASAGVISAQQTAMNDRVAKSMPTQYAGASCNIKPGHFKVGSAAGYLKSAIETDVPESRTRILGQGEKVVLEAIRQNRQDKNPAAWYYLGRIYLQEGNLSPADSALTRAEQLAPDCAKDIASYRRNAWVALVKAGNKFEEDKNTDSALVLYRQAGSIYRGSPISFYQTASIMNDKGQPDSAAYYFGLAAASAASSTDTTDLKYRNRSAFNQGALLLNAKKYDQAAVVFEQYLKWVPNDVEAKRGLATAYRNTGKVEQAQALEKELVAAGGGAPGAASAPASQDLMSAGVNAYNDKQYADAAAAFEKLAAAEPYNRDALSNLSNTYLAMKDGAKLAATAAKLVAIEPLSENALKLQGEGYKQSAKVDDAVKTAEQVLALPVDVKASDFSTTGTGATLTLSATGRAAQTPSGKPIAAAAVPITVEFLSGTGQVVATQDAEVPALASGASQDVKVAGQGGGITAWRYKRK
ncbi:MAG TPA: tetratricopeptide repeat protein [Gemmatimonadales bacterium]|nr:tetratricopeptide repeat protein [Gemmatimonadales bacterium]